MTLKRFISEVIKSTMMKIIAGLTFSILVFIFGMLIAGARFGPKLDDTITEVQEVKTEIKSIRNQTNMSNTKMDSVLVITKKMQEDLKEFKDEYKEDMRKDDQEDKEERDKFWDFIKSRFKSD